MNLESWHSPEDKGRFKIVRTDDYSDVPGQIVTANEASGDCCITTSDGRGGVETKSLHFGPGGCRVVSRKR